MLKPESVQGNEMLKILWDFEIQTDQLLPARRPALLINEKNRENLPNSGLFRPGRPQSENQRKQKEK